MHNLKDIRKNTDFYKKKLSERNTKIDIDNILKLDKINRDQIQKKELSTFIAHKALWVFTGAFFRVVKAYS